METINQIYVKYHNDILHYICSKIKNIVLAEELSNDVFVKANRYLHSYDANKSKLNTWLYNIANSVIIDNFRKDKNLYLNINVDNYTDEKGNELFSFISDNKTDSKIIRKELSNSIDIAFGSLKPKYIKIANLYFKEQKQYSEIAEICEIPIGTVKGMINRCREKLQEKLQCSKMEYSINKKMKGE